ncbi:uncharacterized protein TRIVIDRAFT_43408, partial [Trichoderma virens Gv29-8]
NINCASKFRVVRTGTNKLICRVIDQVAKHIAHRVYQVVSFNVTEYSCVVAISRDKWEGQLMFKSSFPCDRDDEHQLDMYCRRKGARFSVDS